MNDKVGEIQDYLRARGIKVSETSIVNTAIDLARRRGGNAVFIGELEKRGDR